MEVITGPSASFVQQQQQSQPDLVGQYGRLLQLKNLQAQQAMIPLQQQEAQQRVQANQLDIQQKQRALKDQEIMSGVMQKWGQPATASGTATPGAAPQSSAPDYDQLLDMARKSGVSYSTYQGLQQHVLDMKAKAATIAKDDAQTGQDRAGTLVKNNGMIVDALSGVINAPDAEVIPRLSATAQQLQQQGLLDQQHTQMAQQLVQSGDPASVRKALDIYAKSLGGYNKLQEQASNDLKLQQEKGKSDPSSPFYAPTQQAVAMGTAPGAAQIQAGEVKQAAAKAGAEAKARQPYEMSLAAQRQALSQGDPQAAAQLLVNGDATLSELKSRGATPDFIAKTLFNARKLSGGKYNAQEADANFKVAQSPANVAFFGSAGSLVSKGGTLDQLEAAGRDIPQGKIPALNSIADWTKAATGSGPLAKYASLALGAADDYAKVMGGGQGSDTSRQQALDLFKANLSPEGRAGSVSGVRGAVNSQAVSRIGSNPIMRRMYSGQFQDPAQSGSSSDLFSQFGGKAH